MVVTLSFLATLFSVSSYAAQKNVSTKKAIIKPLQTSTSINKNPVIQKNQGKSLITMVFEGIMSNILPPVGTKPILKQEVKQIKKPIQPRVLKTLNLKKINELGPKPVKRPARKPVVTGEGVDYSWGYYPGLAGKLKSADRKRFVMRYTDTGEGKEITANEVKELKKAGLGIGIVFEISRDHARPLAGYKAGQADARSARRYLHHIGLPSTMPIYFAVDFEASREQQHAVNDYLKGASSVLGRDKVGVYGGYSTVARALNAKVCKYAWQTYSWSYGKWDKRAQIRQYLNEVKVSGIDTDLNKAVHTDNGIRLLK